MKAIIEGKRYDTEASELIGEAGSNGSRSDFGYWEAGLYRSPRAKRWFLAGEGGPLTQWARRSSGGMRGYGSGIIPLSDGEALAWAEQHLPADVIEDVFGDMIEDA